MSTLGVNGRNGTVQVYDLSNTEVQPKPKDVLAIHTNANQRVDTEGLAHDIAAKALQDFPFGQMFYNSIIEFLNNPLDERGLQFNLKTLLGTEKADQLFGYSQIKQENNDQLGKLASSAPIPLFSNAEQKIKQKIQESLKNNYRDLSTSLGSGEVSPSIKASGVQSTAEAEQLSKLTEQFQQHFQEAAQDPEAFHKLLTQAFGDHYDRTQAEVIRQQALVGDFSWMPNIRLIDSNQLADQSGAHQLGIGLGAFAKEDNTILLSRELLMSDPSKAEKVLAEEVGHALDAKLNQSDAAGDEGDIFSRLLHGEKLSAAQLASLKMENDHGVINVDGREVEVEYDWWSDAVNDVKDVVEKAGDTLADGVKDIGDALVDGAKKVRDFVVDVVEGAADLLGSLLECSLQMAMGSLTMMMGIMTLNFDKIEEGFKDIKDAAQETLQKVLQNQLFQAILTVARFVPIPWVQLAVRMVDMAQAAYSLYQGIKNKSLSMVIGGIANLAGTTAKVAQGLGALDKAQQISNFANVASKASLAYSAIAERDFSAALQFYAGTPGMGANNKFGEIASNIATATNVVNDLKEGNILAAVSSGIDWRNNNTEGDQWVKMSNLANGALALKSFEEGQYQAAQSYVSGMSYAIDASKVADQPKVTPPKQQEVSSELSSENPRQEGAQQTDSLSEQSSQMQANYSETIEKQTNGNEFDQYFYPSDQNPFDNYQNTIDLLDQSISVSNAELDDILTQKEQLRLDDHPIFQNELNSENINSKIDQNLTLREEYNVPTPYSPDLEISLKDNDLPIVPGLSDEPQLVLDSNGDAYFVGAKDVYIVNPKAKNDTLPDIEHFQDYMLQNDPLHQVSSYANGLVFGGIAGSIGYVGGTVYGIGKSVWEGSYGTLEGADQAEATAMQSAAYMASFFMPGDDAPWAQKALEVTADTLSLFPPILPEVGPLMVASRQSLQYAGSASRAVVSGGEAKISWQFPYEFEKGVLYSGFDPTKVKSPVTLDFVPNKVLDLKRVQISDFDEYKRVVRGDLEKNTIYEFDCLEFETDGLARGISSRGFLDTSKTGRRLTEDRSLGNVDGANEFDVGFHSGGDNLGFPGGKLNVSPGNGKPDPINFPGVPNLNQGPYKKLENRLAELANTPGNQIYADFRKVFNEGNLTQRPDSFVVKFRINDGPDIERTFLNQPGG